MKDGGKGTKREFNPYDLSAVAKVSRESRSSAQKPLGTNDPYNVGRSGSQTLSLSGRTTKNR